MNKCADHHAVTPQVAVSASGSKSQADWIGQWPMGEPSIAEVLAEPIVQALMARDGVDEATLLSLTTLPRYDWLRHRAQYNKVLKGAGNFPT